MSNEIINEITNDLSNEIINNLSNNELNNNTLNQLNNDQLNQQNNDLSNNNYYNSDSEYVSDYGSDYEIDYKNDENENIEQTNAILLSTNGFTEEDAEYKKLSYATKNTLKTCNMCGKIYTNDMIIDINNDDLMCYHCFFWINYDLSLRDIADNTTHLTIVEYIIKCKDYHDITLCTRHTNHGGCFICEFKTGFKIINIKNAKLIYEEENEITFNEEDNVCIDIPNANEIVIEL